MPDIIINNITLSFTHIWYVDSVNGNDSTCIANDNTHPAKSVNYVSQNKAISGDAIYALAGSHNITQITGPGGLYDWGKNITYIGDSGETIFIADGTAHASRDHHAVCCYGGSTLINIIFDCNFNNRASAYSCAFFGRDASFVKFDAYNCVFIGKNDSGQAAWVYDNGNSSIIHIYNCLVITNSTMVANYTGRVTTIQNTAFFKGIQLGSATGTTNLAFAVPGDNYSLYTEGFKNTGTGTNPDGSTANIGIDGGNYAWNQNWIPPYFSKLGSMLTIPDSGWQRFDHLNPNITHLAGQNTAGWGNDTTASNYNGSEMSLVSATYPRNQHLFNFTGTKLRIIAPINTNGIKGATVFIDGVGYPCNFYGTLTYQIVVFDIQELTDKEHQCMIVPYFDYLSNTGGSYFYLDAIDIESNAQIKKYDNGLGGWDLTRKSPNSILLDALDGTGTSYFCPVYHDNYYGGCLGKTGKSSGKWYFEIGVIDCIHYPTVGIGASSANISNAVNGYILSTNVRAYVGGNGYKSADGAVYSAYGSTYTSSDVIGVAVDMDAGSVTFYKNGVSQGVAFTNLKTLGSVYPYVWGGAGDTSSSSCFKLNTGGAPFKYSIPEGYTAWDATVYSNQIKGPYLNSTSGMAMTCGANQLNNITSLVASDSNGGVIGNKVITSGKYYWEVQNKGACYFGIGVNTLNNLNWSYAGGMSYGAAPLNQTWLNGLHRATPSLGVNLQYTTTIWNTSNPTRIIGVLLDMDNRTIKFLINGILCAPFANGILPESGVVMAYCRTFSGDAGGWTYDINVGQKEFTYELPIGYKTYGSFNETPTDTLSANITLTHMNDIIISGEINDLDGDQIQYSISLNDNIILPLTSLVNVPININYTIPITSLQVGINTIVVNYYDSKGASSHKTFEITLSDNAPIITASLDKNVIFNNDIYLNAQIIDTDNDQTKYRILINDIAKYDWTDFSDASSISVLIPNSYFSDNINTIKIEGMDKLGIISTVNLIVKKKPIDCVYVETNIPKPLSESLVIDSDKVVYIKIPDLVRTDGYVKLSKLSIKILDGDNSGKSLYLAPIINSWTSETMNSQNIPAIDTTNKIMRSINNSTGIIEIDITTLIDTIWSRTFSFGIAIYGTSLVTFDILDIVYTIDYMPTKLKQPRSVYVNRTNLEWLNLIYPVAKTFYKLDLIKSSSSDFSNEIQVFETSNKADLYHEDKTLDLNSQYYYKIRVTYMDNSFVETNAIFINTPSEKGFKYYLQSDGSYLLKLSDGLAFDDPVYDYGQPEWEGFYTSPDKIKIRSLIVGTIIGGKVSPISMVEILNTYEETDFDIVLRVSQGGNTAKALPAYALLNDANDDIDKTKVEMSLQGDELFSPIYPLIFRLNAQARRTFFIRVTPTIVTSGSTSFQIVLSGRPV